MAVWSYPRPNPLHSITLAVPEPHDIFTLTGRLILLSLNFITIFPFALWNANNYVDQNIGVKTKL